MGVPLLVLAGLLLAFVDGALLGAEPVDADEDDDGEEDEENPAPVRLHAARAMTAMLRQIAQMVRRMDWLLYDCSRDYPYLYAATLPPASPYADGVSGPLG